MNWVDPDGTLHEIYSGTILVGDVYLGQFSYDSGLAAYRWDRASLAYFCPVCGEVWGRLVACDSRGQQQQFRSITVACAEHRDPWNIPGSMLAESFAAHLNELPPEALRREFYIHLSHFENQS